MMNKIINEIRDEERAYYGTRDTIFDCVTISGPKDGESAFKECKNISVFRSTFNLRYPFWHNETLTIEQSVFTSASRAALWYSNNVLLKGIDASGVKAVRECNNVEVVDSMVDSEEFGWKTNHISLRNCTLTSVYAFMSANDVSLTRVRFKGKYSFQYVNGLTIKDSILDTKDAFWHAKDVLVENSTIIGEYLAWYAENITFRKCHIKGTQPLCYSKNIKFEQCTFENCDLAFENSEVNGTIFGTLVSIKNPLKGEIEIDEIPEMIIDDFDRSNGQFKITKRKENANS